MSDAPQTPEPPHIHLARQALTSPTGRATTTLLVAAAGALDLRDLPTSGAGDEHPDVVAALDAVVDSGAWRTVGARALLDSDDPSKLFAEARRKTTSRVQEPRRHGSATTRRPSRSPSTVTCSTKGWAKRSTTPRSVARLSPASAGG